MEKPVDKEAPPPGAGDVYFVLERATLETAKVGKARQPAAAQFSRLDAGVATGAAAVAAGTAAALKCFIRRTSSIPHAAAGVPHPQL